MMWSPDNPDNNTRHSNIPPRSLVSSPHYRSRTLISILSHPAVALSRTAAASSLASLGLMLNLTHLCNLFKLFNLSFRKRGLKIKICCMQTITTTFMTGLQDHEHRLHQISINKETYCCKYFTSIRPASSDPKGRGASLAQK